MDISQEWIANTIMCWRDEPTTAAELIWKNLQIEIKQLEKQADKLDALESAGVDNWSGYPYAMELLNETT